MTSSHAGEKAASCEDLGLRRQHPPAVNHRQLTQALTPAAELCPEMSARPRPASSGDPRCSSTGRLRRSRTASTTTTSLSQSATCLFASIMRGLLVQWCARMLAGNPAADGQSGRLRGNVDKGRKRGIRPAMAEHDLWQRQGKEAMVAGGGWWREAVARDRRAGLVISSTRRRGWPARWCSSIAGSWRPASTTGPRARRDRATIAWPGRDGRGLSGATEQRCPA
jgi:hypothetical protein